jgi:hypothetical protein
MTCRELPSGTAHNKPFDKILGKIKIFPELRQVAPPLGVILDKQQLKKIVRQWV